MAELTDSDLEGISQIMYDIASTMSCNIFDGGGLPICKQWVHLSAFERDTAKRGLKERITRETLSGYLERKKREVPAAKLIYDETINKLKAKKYI